MDQKSSLIITDTLNKAAPCPPARPEMTREVQEGPRPSCEKKIKRSKSSALEMDGAAVGGENGLVHHFGKRGVGEDGLHQLGLGGL